MREPGVVEEGLDELQACLGRAREGQRGGAVDADDGRGCAAVQLGVERGDLRPVGRRGVGGGGVQRGDGGLQLVGPGRSWRQGLVERMGALGDPATVPERAVLAIQRDVLAAFVDARVAAGVLQQHQREQAERLGVAGQQVDQQAPEADRLAAELAADEAVAVGCRVALVEHQVDDGQDAVAALGRAVRPAGRGRGCAQRRSCAWRA